MSAGNKQVIFITGANTGIGLEIVKALCGSDKAYSIILAGRSPEKVQEAIKTVRDEFPNTASTLDSAQLDLEDDASITKAFEEISASYDCIDALINNGGEWID